MSIKSDLDKLLKYLWHSEQKSCEEYVASQGNKKSHIFSVIERLDAHQEMVSEEYYALGQESDGAYVELSEKDVRGNHFSTLKQAVKERKLMEGAESIVILHVSVLKA
jgi:hypothetical protein